MRPQGDPDDLPEPPKIRALRRLVTALTLVLILGMITIAATLVLRISRTPASPTVAVAAERVVLPAGERVTASGVAEGMLMLVTRDAAGVERLRLYDSATGEPRQVVTIARAGE